MLTMLSMKTACVYLGVSRPTLLEWVRTGQVKAYRLGSRWKFYASDLDAALKDVAAMQPHQGEVEGTAGDGGLRNDQHDG